MRQREYFMIENSILFAICFEVLGIVWLAQDCIYHSTVSIGWVIFNVLWCLLWAAPFIVAHVKRIGESEIEPNVLSVSDIDAYFEKLAECFPIRERIELKDESCDVLFAYGKKRRMIIRLLIVHMEDFDKERYDKIKRSANRYVNKKYEIPRETSLAGPRHARINAVITDSGDEVTERMARKNAEGLFGRVEPILYVTAHKDTQTINIPAHFGIAGIYQYNKIWNILKRLANEAPKGKG